MVDRRRQESIIEIHTSEDPSERDIRITSARPIQNTEHSRLGGKGRGVAFFWVILPSLNKIEIDRVPAHQHSSYRRLLSDYDLEMRIVIIIFEFYYIIIYNYHYLMCIRGVSLTKNSG